MIVAPVAILLFVISLTILVTMRAAPQFNFMSYGMSLRLIAGLGGLIMFLPEICGAIQHLLYRASAREWQPKWQISNTMVPKLQRSIAATRHAKTVRLFSVRT